MGAVHHVMDALRLLVVVILGVLAGAVRLLPGVLVHLARAAMGLEKRTVGPLPPRDGRRPVRFTSEALLGAGSGFIDAAVESRGEGEESAAVRIHLVEDDGEMRIEDDGQQLPPLVFVHGFPGLWLEWEQQLRFFREAGHRVVAVSLRGYGESDRPEGVERYRMGRLVEDIAAAVEHASTGFPDGGRRKPLLVAHDWGAAVCWASSLRSGRESICGYVALSVPPSRLFMRALGRSLRQMYSSLYILFFMVPVLPELAFGGRDAWLTGLSLSSSVKEPDARLIEACRRNMMASCTPALNYYRAMLLPQAAGRGGAARQGDGGDGKAPFPILMIRGEEDVALTAAVFEGYQDELGPNARLLSIRNCSVRPRATSVRAPCVRPARALH